MAIIVSIFLIETLEMTAFVATSSSIVPSRPVILAPGNN
jgi:hypothetical protein